MESTIGLHVDTSEETQSSLAYESSILTPRATATKDGFVVGCNETFLKLCGLTKSEVQGKSLISLARFSTPEEAQEAVQNLEKLNRASTWKSSLDNKDATNSQCDILVTMKEDTSAFETDASKISVREMIQRRKQKYLDVVLQPRNSTYKPESVQDTHDPTAPGSGGTPRHSQTVNGNCYGRPSPRTGTPRTGTPRALSSSSASAYASSVSHERGAGMLSSIVATSGKDSKLLYATATTSTTKDGRETDGCDDDEAVAIIEAVSSDSAATATAPTVTISSGSQQRAVRNKSAMPRLQLQAGLSTAALDRPPLPVPAVGSAGSWGPLTSPRSIAVAPEASPGGQPRSIVVGPEAGLWDQQQGLYGPSVAGNEVIEGSSDMSGLTAAPSVAASMSGLSILVVDDSELVLKMITKILGKEGHRTTTACNGSEALRMMDGSQFDVVLMDINMPEMGGLEAAFAMRLHESASLFQNQDSSSRRASRSMRGPIAASHLVTYARADSASEKMTACTPNGVEAGDTAVVMASGTRTGSRAQSGRENDRGSDELDEASENGPKTNDGVKDGSTPSCGDGQEKEKEREARVLAAGGEQGSRQEPRQGRVRGVLRTRQRIIGMTGDFRDTTIHEVMAAGFDAFLPKPFDLRAFRDALTDSYAEK